ncbi:MAG TPA: protein translocase subunit SecF [Methanocorpusculum sp.]|jgi:preprotein translocase subunit SecF|nr:protein translocase subunit SecF [Methanocorpusculum sp.]HJJ65641.1 protein translocase subunit SecF [Methanocorpusculum sp.]HJJ79706.1 protein translocase subunit SecF [Methanocorpusculum sp.]HJJ85149.1 protein translocase subunit SecF [Methanocorpusculum sp.]HJJ85824.1 protein translocase subunit SecF [Methanocorpusculum sp.]
MKKFKYDINKYNPKKMMAVPASLFAVAAVIVIITFIMTGMPVTPGIDFAGGTAVTIYTDDSKEELEAYFEGYDLKSIDEGISGGYYLKFGPMSNEEMMAFNDYILEGYPDAGIDQIGANFGATLQAQAFLALLFAFLGMAVVVFIAFRKILPALTVVFAGVADITITAACMNIFGIELSLATTAALLMLIGYSVDSNILLTTKVLKRQGNLEEKMEGAFHTGFIMTSTTFCAILAMFIVSLIGNVPTLYTISAVLLIGLICDLIFTWGFNAGMLKLYISKGVRR